MRERFTDKEWAQLERLPAMVFQFVALVDGDLADKEAAKFASELGDAGQYRDPLVRELFSDLGRPATFRATYQEATRIGTTSAEAIDHEFKEIRALLQAKLSVEEYHRFMTSLIFFGSMIATSAGGEKAKKRLFRHKEEVPSTSPRELAALATLAGVFEVDLDAGQLAARRL